jgi:hypothetical protein
MPRSIGLLVMVVALALVAASPGPAARRAPAAQTKARAEVNVLQAVARKWRTWGRHGLVDPKTHLITDNTEAVCHGRGNPRAGKRYARFLCVVRPHDHRGRQGLWLTYRALKNGRCRVRLLAYHRR